jgi:hypothetical protein
MAKLYHEKVNMTNYIGSAIYVAITMGAKIKGYFNFSTKDFWRPVL